MNKLIEGFLIFIAIALILLGMVFVIASGIDNTMIGALMILVAVGIFIMVYYIEKIEAAKPTLVSPTYNVKMEGSSKFNERELKCKSCGAPLTDKDLRVIQGGIMVTCPYCGSAYALEEEPKW